MRLLGHQNLCCCANQRRREINLCFRSLSSFAAVMLAALCKSQICSMLMLGWPHFLLVWCTSNHSAGRSLLVPPLNLFRSSSAAGSGRVPFPVCVVSGRWGGCGCWLSQSLYLGVCVPFQLVAVWSGLRRRRGSSPRETRPAAPPPPISDTHTRVYLFVQTDKSFSQSCSCNCRSVHCDSAARASRAAAIGRLPMTSCGRRR